MVKMKALPLLRESSYVVQQQITCTYGLTPSLTAISSMTDSTGQQKQWQDVL
jgi:hypothetical protein